jgi:NAD(P)-dependent dehydrogenase (short-subunit alcohol dehydrogenase family)
MTRLDGRVAVVTGASRGVGRAIAIRLAADGAAVAVNYRREHDAAEQVVEKIVAAGGQAAVYQASIDDGGAVRTMVEAARHDLGPIDIVISNAGIAGRGDPVARTPQGEFLSLMQVHAFGPIGLIQAALPDLRAAGRGDIVMISSDTVATAPPLAAPYSMAKAAMEMCILTLAREERRFGVHANIIAPGLVATDMGRRLVRATDGGALEDLDAAAPFGRVCRPGDVAGTVAYLVSDDARYVTGQKVFINGGGPEVAIY